MLMPSRGMRIMVATKPVDFRKGHGGLAALAQSMLAEDRKRRLRRTCCHLDGMKFHGSRSSIFSGGRPAATASSVPLR